MKAPTLNSCADSSGITSLSVARGDRRPATGNRQLAIFHVVTCQVGGGDKWRLANVSWLKQDERFGQPTVSGEPRRPDAALLGSVAGNGMDSRGPPNRGRKTQKKTRNPAPLLRFKAGPVCSGLQETCVAGSGPAEPTGRKRIPNRERLTAEDDALSRVARQVRLTRSLIGPNRT